MTKGIEFDGSRIQIWNEARVVATTDGTLVNFLTTEEVYSFNAAYPDVPKAEVYFWSWVSSYSSGAGEYGWGCTGIAAVGARPQEWSNTLVLGAAPAGADIFLGRAKLTRSVNPSHNWVNQPLVAPPFNDVWVPINGSMMLEEAWGFGRALSVYISGGNLVCFLQQTVGPAPGGFRSWGASSPQALSFSQGGENYSANPGIPVYSPTTAPGRKVSSGTTDNTFWIDFTKHHRDATDRATYSDPTNYASTYAVEVRGRFGRRS